MKLLYLVAVDRVESVDGNINFMNVYSNLNFSAVPAHFTFSIVAHVHDIDLKKYKSFRVDAHSPMDEVIHSSIAEFPPVPIEMLDRPNIKGSLGCAFEFRNIVLKTEGLYTFKLYVDDDYIGETYLEVSSDGEEL